MTTEITKRGSNQQAVATELEKVLADENVLYLKSKNAHWNVEGIHFYEKHKFFEEQIGQLNEIIDNVAEKIRMLGHYPAATMTSYLKLTHLTESSSEKNDGLGFVKELLSDHESIIIHLHECYKTFSGKYNDAVSGDFVIGLISTHEKMAWFLRSQLK